MPSAFSSRGGGTKFYAIHLPEDCRGVYGSWALVKPLVSGRKGAKFKSFLTEDEARHFASTGGTGAATVGNHAPPEEAHAQPRVPRRYRLGGEVDEDSSEIPYSRVSQELRDNQDAILDAAFEQTLRDIPVGHAYLALDVPRGVFVIFCGHDATGEPRPECMQGCLRGPHPAREAELLTRTLGLAAGVGLKVVSIGAQIVANRDVQPVQGVELRLLQGRDAHHPGLIVAQQQATRFVLP